MGRLGITYEMVAGAASKLAIADINPTIERIRRELGDTGSYSNIARHFREWKAKHFNNKFNSPNISNILNTPGIPNNPLNSTQTHPNPLNYPKTLSINSIPYHSSNPSHHELPDSIKNVVGQFWVQIQIESEARREQIQKEMDLILETERQEMNLAIIDLQKENAVLKERLQQSENNLKNLKQDMRVRLEETMRQYESQFVLFKQQLEKSMKEAIEYRELLEKRA